MRRLYPFSAIVGQEKMKTALLLSCVDPGIGGVLIQGHKGTAKSTAARGLVSLLPSIKKVKGCAFNCPPDRPRQMHDECLKRFQKKEELQAVLARCQAKLDNENFINRAKPEIVQRERERQQQIQDQLAIVLSNLDDLS